MTRAIPEHMNAGGKRGVPRKFMRHGLMIAEHKSRDEIMTLQSAQCSLRARCTKEVDYDKGRSLDLLEKRNGYVPRVSDCSASCRNGTVVWRSIMINRRSAASEAAQHSSISGITISPP